MFSPQAIARSKVVYAREVLEAVDRRLALRDAELVLEFPGSSNSYAELILLDLLFFKVVERVRAAGVGPHVREGNLLRRALLKQQFAI